MFMKEMFKLMTIPPILTFNEQKPLASYHWMTYGIWKFSPSFGQAQKCGWVKPSNRIPSLPL